MLCEMSTVYKHSGKPYISINSSETKRKGNEYFKVYNTSNFITAKKCARIFFLKPEITYHKGDGKLAWLLTKNEMKKIVDILNSESHYDSSMTVFQFAILEFNREFYDVPHDQTKQIFEYEGAGHPLPINLEIPDYLSIDFNKLESIANKKGIRH